MEKDLREGLHLTSSVAKCVEEIQVTGLFATWFFDHNAAYLEERRAKNASRKRVTPPPHDITTARLRALSTFASNNRLFAPVVEITRQKPVIALSLKTVMCQLC